MPTLDNKCYERGLKMKGARFVKVTSVLMIIGGVIAAIASILGIMGIGAALVLVGNVEGIGLLYATTALVVISSIIQILAGVKGLKASKEPERAQSCIIYGFIIAILTFVSVAINMMAGSEFNFLSLVTNLLVPILYIYGLVQLRNGVDAKTNTYIT